MTATRNWICPACSYLSTRPVGVCPLCNIPLAPKSRPRPEAPQGGSSFPLDIAELQDIQRDGRI
jgi:hypothetical protein